MKVVPQAVRIKFDTEFAPLVLQKTLNQNKIKLSKLKRNKVINAAQWEHLFPTTGMADSYFSVLIMFLCSLYLISKFSLKKLISHQRQDRYNIFSRKTIVKLTA